MQRDRRSLMTGITRNVIVLGVVSLLTDISSEMLYPIIPIFLTSVIGVSMPIMGLIEGAAELLANVMKAAVGWWSDRTHARRPFVIWGYFLSSVGKLMLAFAYVWPAVLLARLIDRLGKGVRTAPRDAMIADACLPEYKGKAFGFHRAMDTVGACIGPLLAIVFLKLLHDDIRKVFLVAFLPAIAGVAVLIVFLRDIGKAIPAQGTPKRHVLWSRSVFTPPLIKFFIVSTIFSLGNSSDAFLIMRAKDVGLSLPLVILAYVVYNISYSALSFPAGIISDSMHKARVFVIGLIVFAAVYAGFAFIASGKTVWFLFLAYGCYMAFTDGVSKAYIAECATREHLAAVIGLYHCVTGVSVFLASVIAGWMWSLLGVRAPFLYGSFMSVAACAVYLIPAGRPRPRSA